MSYEEGLRDLGLLRWLDALCFVHISCKEKPRTGHGNPAVVSTVKSKEGSPL